MSLPTLPHSGKPFWRKWTGRSRRVQLLDWDFVEAVRDRREDLRQGTPNRLRDETRRLRQIIASDGITRVAAANGMALAMEAIQRVHGLTLYDEQILAGWALLQGTIAQVDTGEGKTLVAALPAMLQAFCGRGVHVATTNPYLAERDFAQLRPVFESLGISVGLSRSEGSVEEKRAAYALDVTYATGYELGFDFLRDEVARRHAGSQPLGTHCLRVLRGEPTVAERIATRPPHFAVIDEVDSVLIDEALTPLVIAGHEPSHAAHAARCAESFRQADELASSLVDGRHYRFSDLGGGCELTAEGRRAVVAARPSQETRLVRSWTRYVEQALQARQRMSRDVQYVVADGQIQFVDEFTGRIFPERQWQDGLHQALEAKEGVEITPERVNQATITRQRFFRRYPSLCGMTGTAVGHEVEFSSVYRLPVVVIPPHRPNQRQDLPARFFADDSARLAAIVADCQARTARGQPILIGTRTISRSQRVAEALAQAGLPFQLLNGKQDEDEATLVGEAGRVGAITVATNMAGRGTDIGLGEGARERGGLHVIGVERHGARRIDRQLSGRAGRQGDPGSSQFYVSADDELLTRFAPQLVARLRRHADDHGEARLDLSLDVARAQQLCETQETERRAQLLRHDDWVQETLRMAR